MDTIQDGVVVIMHYTLKNDQGETLDSSDGGDALPYLHGANNIVSGLERQMTGRTVGEQFTVVVPAAEAYGDHDGEEPEPVPLEDLPPELEEGMPIIGQLADGTEVELWVVGIEPDHALLSQNHPLAGVDLTFDIDIKSMRAATDAEREQGHPDGVDGTDSN